VKTSVAERLRIVRFFKGRQRGRARFELHHFRVDLWQEREGWAPEVFHVKHSCMSLIRGNLFHVEQFASDLQGSAFQPEANQNENP